MNIAACDGDLTLSTWPEIENFLLERARTAPDDIWLNGDAEYPCLAILVNGRHACVHYFLNDQGDMWQSVGDGGNDICFLVNGEHTEMPADSVISLEDAIACAKHFFDSPGRPDCIEWREL